MRYALTCLSAHGVAFSDDLLGFIKLYILIFTGILTVYIHTLGPTVNILSSLCEHSQLWANLSQLIFFSRNYKKK